MTAAKVAKTLTRRAYIYTRVSADKSGRARSPKEQEHDARIEATRLSCDVVEVLCDNDRGASRFSVGARPAFEELCRLIGAGKVDVVLVWELSRITRDPEVWAQFAALCRKHGVAVIASGREYDLDDPDAAFEAGLSNLLGEREVGTTRKRVKRALDATRDVSRGGHALHGRVQLGYRRVRDDAGRTVGQEPDELREDGTGGTADVIRELFARTAAGESSYALALDLNARGIKTRMGGGTWTSSRVTAQIKDAVGYLGHRRHNGDIVARNVWPALVDEVTYYAAQRAIAGRPGFGHDTTVKHLLTSILRCATCGAGLNRNGGPYPHYRCPAGVHVARSQAKLDEIVERLVVERLSLPDALPAFVGDDADTFLADVEALEALKTRLAEAEEQLLDDTAPLSPAMYARLEAKLRPQIEAAERAIAAPRSMPAEVVALAAAPDVAAAWARLKAAGDIPGMRRVVRALLVDAKLHPNPAGRAGGRYSTFVGLSYRWAGEERVREL